MGAVTASAVVLGLQYPKKSVVNSEETEARNENCSEEQLTSICSSLSSLASSEDFLLVK